MESWITDHGFDSPLQLANIEATEAARRVHEAVEEATARAERAAQGVEDGGEGLEDGW